MPSLTLAPGRFSPTPQRLRIIRETRRWIALEKPAGVVGIREGWASSRVFSLADALRAEWEAGGAQLRESGWEGIFPICSGDPEGPGIFLLAKTAPDREALKNAMGGGEWRFVHQWIAPRQAGDPPQLRCDLPLARHWQEPRMLVSHKTGKRTETVFEARAVSRYFTLWEAISPYLRPHQFRVHALECGLHVPGDALYHPEAPVPPELLRQVPLAQRTHFHPWRQSALQLNEEEVVTAPPPPGWGKLLKDFGVT